MLDTDTAVAAQLTPALAPPVEFSWSRFACPLTHLVVVQVTWTQDGVAWPKRLLTPGARCGMHDEATKRVCWMQWLDKGVLGWRVSEPRFHM